MQFILVASLIAHVCSLYKSQWLMQLITKQLYDEFTWDLRDSLLCGHNFKWITEVENCIRDKDFLSLQEALSAIHNKTLAPIP